MTKTQLVGKLAEDTGISRKQMEEILTALVELIRKSVKKGDTVKIPDLGGWRMRQMKARMGRNPQTGEPIKIPAKRVVKFRVAKMAKDSILGKK